MSSPEADSEVPNSPAWGVGLAVAGFVVGVIASGVMVSVWLAMRPDEPDGVGALAFGQVGLWAGLAGAAVVAVRRSPGGAAEVLGLVVQPRDWFRGLWLGVGAQLVGVPVLALLLSPLLGAPEVEGPVQDLVREVSGPEVVSLILLVAVGAPLVEEVFYRAVLYLPLAARLGATPSVLITGLLFGVSHYNPTLSAEGQVLVVVSLTALGVLLATMVRRSGRLGLAVTTHVWFNATTLVFLLV